MRRKDEEEVVHGDVRSWLKAEMLKGLQEESLKEVEGPFIFGNFDDGSPAWEIVYTANGWPYIRGKEHP